MMFNERVLSLGKLRSETDNIGDLNNIMFYNNIFISNTLEIFDKYECCDSSMEIYYQLCEEYLKNLLYVRDSLISINLISREQDRLAFEELERIEGTIVNEGIVERNYHLNEYIRRIEFIEKSRYMSVYREISINSVLKRDILIEYPADNFDSYLSFLYSLSNNPNRVKSIELTLYRIGDDPSLFGALKNAVKNGIDVWVNIELHAYGDEERNEKWADRMVAVGINVTHNVNKVHSKLTLIRLHGGMMISQIGTGNHHTLTTTQYTDFSLITSDYSISEKVSMILGCIFGEKYINRYLSLTNKYSGRGYNELPFTIPSIFPEFSDSMRAIFIEFINRESDKGENGYISFKCNSLDDPKIMIHLDRAAEHGCRIDLIIRGACTWVPSQLGDNVRIKSIVWDKLEHSRVFCFGKFDPIIYIGSLDLVESKIDNRIETLVRIKDPDILLHLVEYMNRCIMNTENSWDLSKYGHYMKE